MTQIINGSTRSQLDEYMDLIIDTIEVTLCDEAPKVREQAGVAFQTLHKMVGPKVVDIVVPTLFGKLNATEEGGEEGGSSDDDGLEEDGLEEEGKEMEQNRALLGLCQVLRMRARELLPVIMTPLLKAPMSRLHIEALGTVAIAASRDVHHVSTPIIAALMRELSDVDGDIIAAEAEAGSSEGAAERVSFELPKLLERRTLLEKGRRVRALAKACAEAWLADTVLDDTVQGKKQDD